MKIKPSGIIILISNIFLFTSCVTIKQISHDVDKPSAKIVKDLEFAREKPVIIKEEKPIRVTKIDTQRKDKDGESSDIGDVGLNESRRSRDYIPSKSGSEKSRHYEERMVDINCASCPLRDVLSAIASDYNIIYGDGVNAQKSVDINIRNLPLTNAIKAIVESSSYFLDIDKKGKVVTVSKYLTKTFKLPLSVFDQSSGSIKYEVSNDVISSSSGGISGTTATQAGGTQSNLKALFSVSKEDKEDTKKAFETTVKMFLSHEGKAVFDWISGNLIVTDYPVNVASIESYLKRFKDEMGQLLYIEAMIMEVTLSDAFKFGIDWSKLAQIEGGRLTASQSGATKITSPFITIEYKRNSNSFSSILKALEEQGFTKVLAQPRQLTINNLPASIMSTKSTPYVSNVQQTYSTATTGTTPVTTSFNIERAQEGVSLWVRPHIEEDRETISLTLIPILSNIEAFKEITIGSNTAENPILTLKQSYQQLRIKSGSTIVIGGVQKESISKTTQGVPIISKIPIFGELFKSHSDSIVKSELVIALRVTKLSEGIPYPDRDGR